MVFVGLDIGGANLKAALSTGEACSLPFPLWRHPAGLAEALRQLLAQLPLSPDTQTGLAVTMTGELCDCFASKREGVLAILEAVARIAGSLPVWVWGTDGRLLPFSEACQEPLRAAAANWLALAHFVGLAFSPAHEKEKASLLLDMGSTTTDIVPLRAGIPVPVGRTDPERLRSGELVYTGVRRTPVCALLGDSDLDNWAAEFFATTLDVYLVLGLIPESDSTDTADGRPATRRAAEARLARMICADLESSTAQERLELAQRAAARQRALIRRGLDRVLKTLGETPATVYVSGEGEFLIEGVLGERLPGVPVVRLGQELDPDISRAACAYAVAVLADRRSKRGEANGR